MTPEAPVFMSFNNLFLFYKRKLAVKLMLLSKYGIPGVTIIKLSVIKSGRRYFKSAVGNFCGTHMRDIIFCRCKPKTPEIFFEKFVAAVNKRSV